MTRTTLSVLNSTGDIKLTWDHSDPAECEKARAEVARLKELGYSFFLVDGNPADEVNAGGGTLIVKRLTAEELINPPAAEPETEQTEPPAEQSEKRRGRPKGSLNKSKDRQAVAVRPLRGG